MHCNQFTIPQKHGKLCSVMVRVAESYAADLGSISRQTLSIFAKYHIA